MKHFGILLSALFLMNLAPGQENPTIYRFEPGKDAFRHRTPPALSTTNPKAGNATVILTTEDVWGDGTGYQMLLDASATAYGTLWDNSTAFPMEGTAEDVYADVDYKIPANADPDLNTSNIVCARSEMLEIPAGTYDIACLNPTPGEILYVARGGCFDNYVFEAGKCYEFYIYKGGVSGGHDTVIPRQIVEHDIAVLGFVGPYSGCLLEDEQVGLRIYNAGFKDIAAGTLKARYRVDGQDYIEETVDQAIPWWDTLVFHFSEKADLSAAGAHRIEAGIVWDEDTIHQNDTASLDIVNMMPWSGTLPFRDDFASAENIPQNGWTIINADENGNPAAGVPEWEFMPNIGHDPVDEYNGTCMSCYGVWNRPSNAYLISPPIPLKKGNARISLWARIAGGGLNYVESFSVMLGRNLDVNSMETLAEFDEISNPNWVRFPVNADIPEDGNYFFAIRANSATNMLGIHVDDVEIDSGAFHGSPDLAIRAIDIPKPSCGLTTYPLSVEVFNNGDSDIDSLRLTYRINQNEAISETFFERIQMQTKKKLTFSQYVDFSQENVYVVEVHGECAHDTNANNNTLRDTTEHIVPYATPWESDMSFSDWSTDAEGAWVHVEAESGDYMALRKMGNLVSHCISLDPGKYILRYEYQAGHMISYFPWGVYFNVAIGPTETDPWLWPSLKNHSNANTGEDFEWAELTFEIDQSADYSLAFLPLTTDTLFIRDVVLSQMAENDMTIPHGPELPRTIPCSQSGDTYTFQIPTQNRGLQDATDVVVSLYENEQLLGKSSPVMVPAEQTIDIAVPAQLPSYGVTSVSFKAEVSFGAEDSYPENDTLSFLVTFSDSSFLFDAVTESQMGADGGLGANYPIEAGYVIDLQIPDTLTSVSVGFCESVDMPFGIAVYQTDGAVKGRQLYAGSYQRGIGGKIETFATDPLPLTPGKYLIVVQQTGYQYMQLACDDNRDGYLIVPQSDNDSLFRQTGFGSVAVRPNFGFAHLADPDLYVHSIVIEDTALFSTEQQVLVLIGNRGTSCQKNVDICCLVDKQTYNLKLDSVPPHFLSPVSFNVDLSEPGFHYLSAISRLDGDANPGNDTLSKVVYCLEEADPYVLDFEDCNDFSITGFNPAWKTVDLDSALTQFYSMSGWPNKGMPQAFMAFNAGTCYPSMENYISGYTGERFGVCFAAIEDTNNDWLISPKLAMPAQGSKLEMQVMSASADYGLEQYNVLVSTTTDQLENFLPVGEPRTAPAGEWQQVEVDLSQYDGQEIHIAIQCVTPQGYAFFIDDIRVSAPASNQAAISGQAEVFLFPNPATDAINIHSAAEPISRIEVFNTLGQVVYRLQDMDSSDMDINTSSWPRGAYFIQVQAGKISRTLKCILQ